MTTPVPLRREDTRMMHHLSDAHLEQLRDSGLSTETMHHAGLYTEHSRVLIYELLGWQIPKRWAKTRADGPWPANHNSTSLIIPHYLPGATEPYAHASRPDHPRPNKKKDKKPIKYETPRDDEPLVYFTPRARRSDRYRSTAIKVWTEGAKKALLLDQLGYTVIGLSGVWNAHDSTHRTNTGEWQLHRLIREYVRVEGCEHLIVFDFDEKTKSKEDVDRAARQLAKMLLDAGGTRVRFTRPPAPPGCDKLGIDDYYMLVERAGERGADAIAQLFADAPKIDPSKFDKRPTIIISTDVHRTVDEASAVLPAAQHIYCRGSRLVRVLRSAKEEEQAGIKRPADTPSIDVLPIESLWETLSRYARFVTLDGQGDETPVQPPMPIARALAARGHWPGVRELVRVVDAPLLRPDGEIVRQSGYDAETRTLVALTPEIEALQLPEKPTQEDAHEATKRLLELVSDFPFEAEAAKAAWLAGMLTLFAREAFDGPAPMFVIDANGAGTGKGKLAQVAAIIGTGRDAGAAGYVCDAGEMTKRITSIARRGDALVLLDNIEDDLGDAALDRALTTTIWTERILGTNDEPTLPLMTTWWATSNNADVQRDTLRRVIPVRLASPLERPEERTGFKHEDLLAYVRENRAAYVRDALIILRAHVVAKRPTTNVGILGSYEGWRKTVAAAVHFACGVDPISARSALQTSQGNRELEALRSLIRKMWVFTPMKARELLDRLGPEMFDDLITLKGQEQITPKRVGKALRRLAGRKVLVGKQMMELVGQLDENGTNVWRAALVVAEPANDNAHPPDDEQPHDAASADYPFN